MNRQTAFQAKESAPTKKSSFSLLRHSAVNPVAEAETLPGNAAGGLVVDFTKVPVRPMQLPGVPGFSCPFAPQRCPSGGACHTCPPKLQAKLKIGQPGDQYEQEADRVAETVMRMPEPQVQRKGCSAPGCKEEDEDKKLLQTKSAGGGESRAYVDHPLIQSVLSSPGQPLDAATRSFMEPRFGQDFSGVRVHLGGEAAESARAVNARAYTVGRNVVFGEGQYAPGSDEGKRLMAHELAHVMQQVGEIQKSGILAKEKIALYPLKTETSCHLSQVEYSIQRITGFEEATAVSILAWCASGAAITVLFDQIFQVGKWLMWGSGPFQQDWCSMLFSALFGCVFGMAGGAAERMIFQDAAKFGAVGFLRWAQRKLLMAGYNQLSGKIGLAIAKAGC